MASIKVRQKKSLIGQTKKTVNIVHGLGLRKINAEKTHPDNNCIRGMINKVKHLVDFEIVNEAE